MAAVTKDHTLSGLKQHRSMILPVWGQTSKVGPGLCPFWRLLVGSDGSVTSQDASSLVPSEPMDGATRWSHDVLSSL